MCLALYNCGKASRAHGASCPHHAGPTEPCRGWFTPDCPHSPQAGPGHPPVAESEIPRTWGYGGMISLACPLGGLASSMDCCLGQGSLTWRPQPAPQLNHLCKWFFIPSPPLTVSLNRSSRICAWTPSLGVIVFQTAS